VGSSHGCNTSGPSGGEPSKFNDPDPDDDEYVSFNDEGMYNSDGDDGLDQNHNAKSVALVNSDLMMTDSVHEEPTVDDTVHIEPLFTHDLENPRIEVGASFPDVNTFRRALRALRICRGGNNCAEISGVDSEGKVWRHAVELDKHECT
jgi:hypothetical protein